MGLGAAVTNPKIVDAAVEELKAITGQKPVVTRSKKAIASFKLRAGIPIGAMVTLRSDRMWEFLDRLVTLALPRTRDFRGVSRKAFDGKGNYTLGLKEQIIFPEINYDRIDVIKGLNISFVTTAKTDEEGRALLAAPGNALPGCVKEQEETTNGACLSVRKVESRPEVRGPSPQPLQGLRPRARLLPQVRALPYLPPHARAPRGSPGRDQGELVRGAT